MNNIYADYGTIIEGSRYIHRDKAEKEILARMIENDNYASTALVGMQRMGKSSLAYQLLEKRKTELLKEKIVVVKMVMYNYKTPQAFFTGIVEKVFEVMEDEDAVSKKMERRYEKAISESVEETGGERIRSFFKVVKEEGYRVICIIDEFDKSKELFADYPEGFFALRELAYQPENKIAFLFLSRHLMSELEADVGFDVSNFSNILSTSFLTLFTEEEFEEYFENLAAAGISVTDELKNEYREITGRVPFWMDILSFYYINAMNQGKNVTVTEVFEEQKETFYSEFQKLFVLLQDQNLLNTLYQVVLGPLGEEATPKQIKRLENYGMILPDGKGGYVTLSRHFRQYMVIKEQVVDFYPIWNRTEKLLRKVATVEFEKKYGLEWEEKLLELYANEDCKSGGGKFKTLKDYLLDSKRQLEDMKKKKDLYEIDPNEVNILNGSTTGGLAEIIKQEYTGVFDKVFNMKKGEFTVLIQNLTSARNPFDHNNDHLIKKERKEETNATCQKLVKIIEAYLDKN